MARQDMHGGDMREPDILFWVCTDVANECAFF
jgi:hypothetical protein